MEGFEVQTWIPIASEICGNKGSRFWRMIEPFQRFHATKTATHSVGASVTLVYVDGQIQLPSGTTWESAGPRLSEMLPDEKWQRVLDEFALTVNDVVAELESNVQNRSLHLRALAEKLENFLSQETVVYMDQRGSSVERWQLKLTIVISNFLQQSKRISLPVATSFANELSDGDEIREIPVATNIMTGD